MSQYNYEQAKKTAAQEACEMIFLEKARWNRVKKVVRASSNPLGAFWEHLAAWEKDAVSNALGLKYDWIRRCAKGDEKLGEDSAGLLEILSDGVFKAEMA